MNYLGIDSSTKAVHCVVVDEEENIILLQKISAPEFGFFSGARI